jgi:EAL domain-containing protein (putative c-di-GMP-specific phosphodiesterase class I)
LGLKLDDFATGYSCLRYLNRLPFDTIKIDRSFTMDLDDDNPEPKELIRTIMAMAENLSLGVIAEGIESQSSANFLREQGCRFGQGYHFSPPVGAEEAEAMLGLGIQQQGNREGNCDERR